MVTVGHLAIWYSMHTKCAEIIKIISIIPSEDVENRYIACVSLNIEPNPFFEMVHQCLIFYRIEMQEIFESAQMAEIKLLDVNVTHIKVINFGADCCRYDSPHLLLGEKTKLIKLTGSHFRSFKYFLHHEKEVKHLFQFDSFVISRAEKIANKIFGNNYTEQYKFCVDTGRENIVELNPSYTKYFTENAINHILQKLKKRADNVAIVMFGRKSDFLYDIRIEQEVTAVYMPEIRNRGVDLYFGVKYCDALLISIPTSAFTWWTAFLMAEGSPIYYYDCEKECDSYTKKDYFPPQWIPLGIDIRGNVEISER